MRKTAAGYLAIALAAILLAGAVQLHSLRGVRLLKAEYQEKSAAEAAQGAERINHAFELIYHNLRTLASLPGIRSIDRHAGNLSPEARTTLQMIYNNLADSVAVSEVYVTPADFDPERQDNVTGRVEEPIIMFDELILNAGAALTRDQREASPEIVAKLENRGPPEVETFEYRQLADHAQWFKKHYPANHQLRGLRVPLISSPEVITCDNTFYKDSLKDADRQGIIFSVPFFADDGAFKGMISAIILSSALRKLLPGPDYALVNAGTGYVNASLESEPHLKSAFQDLSSARPAEQLIFSSVIPLSTNDERNPWTVWVGYDDNRFYGGAEYKALQNFRFSGFGFAALLLIAGCLMWFLAMRDLQNKQRAALALEQARDEARLKEAEARDLAEKFQSVNDDIQHLNVELLGKVKLLHDAQDEIVRKGRMAQLGQLTATVAHELRNPMGAVRTTAFVLRRKLLNSGVNLDHLLARIDNGISRCDDIITQLLDFARSKKPDMTLLEADRWLVETIEQEAPHLPSTVAIECDLGLGSRLASFDGSRLRRALVNLLNNASEAMVGKDGAGKFATVAQPLIRIESRLTARGIEISVSDNGPGMTPEALAKAREPLFTTKNFGVGLGIPAVERIAELHGGGLDIESVEGHGARFTIWFPTEIGAVHAA